MAESFIGHRVVQVGFNSLQSTLLRSEAGITVNVKTKQINVETSVYTGSES